MDLRLWRSPTPDWPLAVHAYLAMHADARVATVNAHARAQPSLDSDCAGSLQVVNRWQASLAQKELSDLPRVA